MIAIQQTVLCPAFPIGLMEKKVPGSLVGDLFFRAISDQFWRLREGDRFYYENIHMNCDVKNRYRRIYSILQVPRQLSLIHLATAHLP